jgi:hypothetical protein
MQSAPGDDHFRGVFEDMRGPQGPVDACAAMLELGGHAAIEDVDAAKD